MKIRFENRKEFSVCGYAVETELSSSENDVDLLWKNHEKILLGIPASKSHLYGVMWYTEGHRYYYHLGICGETPLLDDMTAVTIPSAHFAIAIVPDNMTIVEAWTEYFETELPSLGYIPDSEHGKYFEFHGVDEKCELWTPVKEQIK